jgi:mannose-6-phosphate isomerase-like protein (cupin superfamily)
MEGAMKGKIFKAQELDWIEAPGHFSAFSKLLVNESSGSKYFDFRISSYQPKGYCEAHVHKTAENIYYILKGEGVVELDGKRHLVGPGVVIFIPPKVKHAIINTGFEDLIFIVAASPPKDMPK